MARKITGDPGLDAMIRQSEKQFGQELIRKEGYPPADSISTGSIKLDIALGIGGVAKNRIIEIMGTESSGKTSLSLAIASQWQKQDPDRWLLIIDLEYSIDAKFLQSFGINTDKVLHVRIDEAEKALQIARDWPKSGKIGMCIFDSVGGAQTAALAKKDIGSADPGGIAKMMHDTLRSVKSTSSEQNCTYIFLNQITYKIGVMFGNPETTPGGTALLYYASQRLKLMPHKESSSLANAHLIRVKCAKNKSAPPFEDRIEIDFVYAKGPDRYLDLINVAKEYKLLRMVTGSAKYKMEPDGEEIVIAGIDSPDISPAGAAGMYAQFEKDPEFYEAFRLAVLKAAGVRFEHVEEEENEEDFVDSTEMLEE